MTDHEIQRDEHGRYVEGQSGFVQHGGAGAVKAIREGRAFTGLAAEAEREVQADLDSEGRTFLVLELARRLHTCARLYYGALQAAVDKGDLEALDRYARRFGWLAGASLRAWEQVRKEQGEANGATLEGLLSEPVEAGSGPDVSD